MHRATPSIVADVRAARTLSQRTAALHNRLRGSTCAIVTCGPSLQQVDPFRFRESAVGVPVIAVKQAIDMVRESADFHCWNSYNVSKYRWDSRDTLRLFIRSAGIRVPQWNKTDVEFPQISGEGDLRNSLAYDRDFGRYMLAAGAQRPFGPGIMYELVVYLAVHLGCTRLITFGWDIADIEGKNIHFDDAAAERSFFERGRSAATSRPARPWRDRLPDPARRAARVVRTRLAHERGRRYNLTASLIGESELVADSTASLNSWLKSLGVDLAVVTDMPHLHPSIQRLSLDEALEELKRAGR